MRIYVAGPMRGYPLWNFPAFDKARDYLIDLGHAPVSPADLDRAIGVTEHTSELPTGFIHAALRRDFAAISTCDAIAFLPGWEKSSGARAERQVASHIGCAFYRVDPDRKTFDREQVIGLSGYAQAGKDTAAEALVKHHGFERRGFADALKAMAYNLNPSVRLQTDREIDEPYHAPLAQLVDAYGWEGAKREPEIRKLLQRLGTEAGGNVLGQHVWIDACLNNTPPRLIVPDCRFPNEADAIRACGGLVVRIERPGCGPVNGHPSETALDSYAFDHVVLNDGTPEQLARRVGALL